MPWNHGATETTVSASVIAAVRSFHPVAETRRPMFVEVRAIRQPKPAEDLWIRCMIVVRASVRRYRHSAFSCGKRKTQVGWYGSLQVRHPRWMNQSVHNERSGVMLAHRHAPPIRHFRRKFPPLVSCNSSGSNHRDDREQQHQDEGPPATSAPKVIIPPTCSTRQRHR